jgi:hypothetical protein
MYKKETKTFRQTKNLQLVLSAGGLVSGLIIKD